MRFVLLKFNIIYPSCLSFLVDLSITTFNINYPSCLLLLLDLSIITLSINYPSCLLFMVEVSIITHSFTNLNKLFVVVCVVKTMGKLDKLAGCQANKNQKITFF